MQENNKINNKEEIALNKKSNVRKNQNENKRSSNQKTRNTKKNIKTEDFERREAVYQKLEEKNSLLTFINTYWDDEKMLKTFPNMKIEDVNGNVIYLDSLLPEIQPYYRKVFEK